MAVWDDISARELRIAAKVARASGGHILDGAAAAWELRAELKEQQEEQLKQLGVPGV